MPRYRIEGVTGPAKIRVMTEWFDEEIGVVEGKAIGFQIRGWENVKVVSEAEVTA